MTEQPTKEPIEHLIGELITYVDVTEGAEGSYTETEATPPVDDVIQLTTASGKVIRIYHDQWCCEKVRVVDTEGNWHDLVGRIIVEATKEEIPKGDPKPDLDEPFVESWTRTTITLCVDDATVISRWIGESNGYYSESVDIKEVSGILSKGKQ